MLVVNTFVVLLVSSPPLYHVYRIARGKDGEMKVPDIAGILTLTIISAVFTAVLMAKSYFY